MNLENRKKLKDKILESVNIIDIVGDYTKLTKKGNTYSGLCPLHDDKKEGNFHVYENTESCICFSCSNEKMNVIDFIVKVENLEFPEAMDFIAEKENIDISDFESPENKAKDKKRMQAFEVFKKIQNIYTDNLNNNPETKDGFLKWRGFEQKTVEYFELGISYIRERNGFKSVATELKNHFDILKEFGVLNKKDFDLLQNRYTIPIHNKTGKVVAFFGRSINKNAKEYKFINSAESPIYNKKKELFNYNRSRKNIFEKKQCFVMESSLSVFRLFEKNVLNTVATGGTAFTKDHLKLFIDNEITFIWDDDNAGRKAAKRALKTCLEENKIPTFILMQKGCDPDDFFKNKTKEETKEYLKSNKINFIDLLLKICDFENTKTLEEKDTIINEVEDYISLIKGTSQTLYYNDFLKKTGLVGAAKGENKELPKPKIKEKPERVFWYLDDKGVPKINMQDYIEFINNKGFFLYYSAKKPDAYEIVRIKNNIIKLADTREIKEIVLNFVKKRGMLVVFNKLAEGTKYFDIKVLNALPVVIPKILKDTATASFVATTKCVYRTTAEKIEKIDFADLGDSYIWDSQITKNDFQYNKELTNSHFSKFTHLISGKNEQKHARLKSILGFLIHNYKNPANAKAPVIYDKNLSQLHGEAEGGSGKSLLLEAVKHIRNITQIPGDRINFKSQFCLQELDESTQIAHIDEVPESLDMKEFFSRITNGIPIEQKQKKPLYIEFEDTPVFIFTGNFKPKGSSGSHRRRRIDFGVEPYFSANYTPFDEFKHVFFKDWNTDEWNCFFSFILNCVKEYLKNGIVEHKDKSDTLLTFARETNDYFAEFWVLEERLMSVYLTGEFFPRAFYSEFLEQNEIYPTDFSIKKYYSYIKKMLDVYEIKHKKEGRGTKVKYILDNGKKLKD